MVNLHVFVYQLEICLQVILFYYIIVRFYTQYYFNISEF